MNWDERRRSDGEISSRAQRRLTTRARAQVLAATPASDQSRGAQDYRMHMLLSTFMLLAALVIANLQ